MQDTEPILEIFEEFHKTHQIIILSENPPLETQITEIFIKKSPEISTPM
ncbi:MAG: hypothetical protein ACXABO_10170 [Promethearchaeota archaeon]